MMLVILVLYLKVGNFVMDKNSFDPKLVFENLKLKYNHKLVIGNLIINFVSNKFDILKLIITGKVHILVITEAEIKSTIPLNHVFHVFPGSSKT